MRNEKQFLVKEISEKIGSADYVYFVSFSGLKVKELEDLRKQLAIANASCHVLKNTLIKRACELLEPSSDAKTFDFTLGTAMVFGKGDCGAVAKLLLEFGKKNDKLAAKGGYVEGEFLSGAQVGSLAELPAKPVLQAMLLGVLQAPSRNLVTVLNAKAASVLNVLNAYKNKVENQ
ncbi:MAG: 50S ribosomal protein L10 [Victivallales bacterium]|jgi:large subunit ribosomal protein L10|nr:50S ribosomal protein L10 [Victivallales bacterium]